jgi:hypothetical protein
MHTHPNHPHQNKRLIRYYESHVYGGKVTFNTISINLVEVSVDTEEKSNNPLVDQHSRTHSCP